MREFYLKNDSGEIFEFNRFNKCLVSNISDIGFNRNIEYVDYGNIYKKVNEVNDRETITLTLIFMDGYKGYKKFLEYIESSKSFFLYYKAIDFKYALVEIESLSKTQIEYGVLKCNLKLVKLSYWFKDVVRNIEIKLDKTGKYYSYTYPYRYSNSISGKVQIENNGYSKAPLKIVISGAFSNPEINVYKDKLLISRAKIYFESDDATLIIESSPLNQAIEIIEQGKKINAYEYQDFSVDNFIFLETGIYEIEFKPFVSTPPKCTIVMTEGYLGN